MSEDKRPRLSSDENDPALREAKPPFGLEKKKWNRLKLRLFVGATLAASVAAFVIITRRSAVREDHELNGRSLAAYYEIASETYGCDGASSAGPEQPAFVGVHQGFNAGPVLVDCSFPGECETVSQRDPHLHPPSIFRGALEDVTWGDWLGTPVILEEVEDQRSGGTRRLWMSEGRCHLIVRQEELAIQGDTLRQSVEILYGSRECTTLEDPDVQCVERRVRELRATRR